MLTPQQVRDRVKERSAARAARDAELQAVVGPGCKASGRRCVTTTNMRVKTPRCCINWNLLILRKIAERLDAAGIPWWIDYGMLLGYCTNGGWYWNDKDTDVNCLSSDRDRVREVLTTPLQDEGMHVRYVPPARQRFTWGDVLKVRVSQTNHNNCDITFWDLGDDGFLDRKTWSPSDAYKGREMPASVVFPTTRGLFEGVEVNVPAEPFQLIAYRYPPDWRNLDAARRGRYRVPGWRDGVKMAQGREEPRRRPLTLADRNRAMRERAKARR